MSDDRKPRPKWHLIYYLLAGFDLIAVSGSLYLNHETMGIYTGSVAVNQEWAGRLSELTTLSDLARETNAPGNDIFDTKNVGRERAARDTALSAFNAWLREVQSNIERTTTSEYQSILRVTMAEIRVAMDEMVREADHIFSHFETGQGELAGRRMATMDRKYRELTSNISKAHYLVQKIQAKNFKTQIEYADALGRFEFLIGGIILLMVLCITLYGHRIAQISRLHERQLNRAKEEAERANKSKTEFLANMSHELRTPLNAIMGFSQIIIEQTFGPVGSVKYRDYANDIHNSGKHLLCLINDILDLSKIEAGSEELREEVIGIASLVQSAAMLIKGSAHKKNVRLVLELPDDPPNLYADERKLKQILVNLLSNAVKFTETGGRVTLKVLCSSKSGCVFQIADTGIGIASEDIPKALMKFGQIDSSLSRKFEGTGLGLPLAKLLTELHGGSLDLQSQAGVGTTVTLRFPAARIGNPDQRARSKSA